MIADPCPCGSGKELPACCGRYLAGQGKPRTAEALMRSRYSAYALGRFDYLEATLHPDARAGFDRAEAAASARGLHWVRLEILGTTGGGRADMTGTVEFAAHYLKAAMPGTLHENSLFRKESGRWFYLGALALDRG